MVGAPTTPAGSFIAGVSQSHGCGPGDTKGGAGGAPTSAVTGLYPWIGYRATERISVWAVGDYGAGGLVLRAENAAPVQSGLLMALAAAEMRGTPVAEDETFECAFKAAALWVGARVHGSAEPRRAAAGSRGRGDAAAEGTRRLERVPDGQVQVAAAERGIRIPPRWRGAEVGSGLGVGGGGPAWRLFCSPLLRGRGGVARLHRPVLGAGPSDRLPAGSACGRLRRRRASLALVVARARRGGRGRSADRSRRARR